MILGISFLQWPHVGPKNTRIVYSALISCNVCVIPKVSFMNEMYQIAGACGVDWEMAVEGFVRDGRIGHSHMNVPGPDGKFGFGGSCFPKDINALLDICRELGVTAKTIYGAWETNLNVRPEQDWKELKGRAVVDEDDSFPFKA